MSAHDLAVASAAALVLAGAAGTALARSATRLVLSLGAFLLGVALCFLALGSPLLAAAQVFVYIGGVLVLVLFALMVVGRGDGESPRVESRHDPGAALVALGLFVVLAIVTPKRPSGIAPPEMVSPLAVADVLLGSGIVAFELAGVLLLAALLAVLVIVKSGGER